jgi:antirestriction protein
MFSNIFLSGYVKELKKIAEYEGNLLEYDIYNILHEIYSDNIKVEYQKVKYRKNVILNNRIIHGEYEYNLYIKDISQKILVDWEMSENGILSITTIKKNDNKNILYKKR